MKNFLKTLICLLLVAFMVFSVIYIVKEAVFTIKNFDRIVSIFTPKPVYAETHSNCVYYMQRDLPGCFEHYVGYIPQMMLDEKNGEATFTFRGGYTVTIKVQQFAKDFWGLEVPIDVGFPFESVEWLHYICFSRANEIELYQANGSGIFYDIDACTRCFTHVFVRDDISIVYTPCASGYVISTSDGTAEVKVAYPYEFYVDSNDGALCINARELSQLLYNWEIANIESPIVDLGSLN